MKSSLAGIARSLVLALAFVVTAPTATRAAENRENRDSDSKAEHQRKEQERKRQADQQAQEKRRQEQDRARQEQERQRQEQDRARQGQERQRQAQDRDRQAQDRQRQEQDRARQAQDHQRQDRERQAEQQQAQDRQRQDLERQRQAQDRERGNPERGNPERGREARDRRATPPPRPAYSLPESRAVARSGPPVQLEPETSRRVLSQVNDARAGMRGINARPLPRGNVYVRPDGALRIESGRRAFGVRQDGTIASFKSQRETATFRPDGRISTIDTTAGIRIRHDEHGGRYVYHERPDHVIVVSQGPRYGYVQRPVFVRNTTYVQRTYVVNNVTYTRVYQPYTYRGVVFYRYAPPVYYRPAYYEWAWQPWPRPVVYRWGWMTAPWYGYYGSYFTPLPSYVSATFWLADFVLAAQLEEAYAMRASPQPAVDYAPSDYGATSYEETAASPITPEVREAISLEVQRQLDEERAASSAADDNEPPPVESDIGPSDVPAVVREPGRVFVVSTALDVVVDDESCSLSPGDVLRLEDVPAPGELSATVRILSSKPQDCAAGGRAVLSIADLQTLYDDFHARVDAGLVQLQSSQGSGKLPPPPANAGGTLAGPGAVVSTPMGNAAATVAETQRNADAAEAELDREIASSDDAR